MVTRFCPLSSQRRAAANLRERGGRLKQFSLAPHVRTLSCQRLTSRCRSAVAGPRVRARESPRGAGHAATGTRAAGGIGLPVRLSGPHGLDGVGCRAEFVGGDVCHRPGLACRVRGVTRGASLVSRRPHGMASRRAGLHHLDLAPHPGAGMLNGLTRPRVAGVSGFEQGQDVLSARGCPQGEQMVIRVRQGPAAADRHQARVAHRREDHGRNSSPCRTYRPVAYGSRRRIPRT